MRRVLFIFVFLLVEWPQVGWAQGDYGFRFVRIQFGEQRSERGRFGRGGAYWSHDYPTAELNLYQALERTTQIYIDGEPLVLQLKDDRIFEYPFLYLCEPGYWYPDEADIDNLREYLDRGGFILFDDFRGDRDWFNLVQQMKLVFPERDFIELPPDHAIWSIYYDIDPVEAPSIDGGGGRFGGGFSKYDDRYLAIFDDEGRMMVLANHNQDIGDGWEWPDQNVADASTISFQMGINFLIYAMTH